MKRKIALVAHDNKKADLVGWADFNQGTLALHTSLRPEEPEEK